MPQTRRLVTAAVVLAIGCSSTEPRHVAPSHPQGVLQPRDSAQGRPYGVAVSSQGTVYATLLDSSKLAVASTATLALTGRVNVGAAPTAVAFNPAGTIAFVANQLSDSIGIVNVGSGTQAADIPIAGAPFNVVVSPNGATVYATSNAPYVHVIDAATHAVTDSVLIGGPAVGMALNPSGSRLYVSDFTNHIVREINTATRVVARSFVVGDTPQGLAVAPDTSVLYVANEDGELRVVSLSSGTVTDSVFVHGASFDLAITPDGAQLYVGRYAAGTVGVLDRLTLSEVNTLTTGGKPRRIAFTADGKTAAIANEGGWIDFVR